MFKFKRLSAVRELLATEALFNALSELTRDRTDISIWKDYYAKRFALGIETLQQRSRGAYLFGLQALRTLGMVPDGIATTLAALKHLEPRQLPELTMIQTLLGKNIAQLTSLVTRKQVLQEEGSQLLEEDLRRYEQVNELLVIKPTDTWNEVVGKAISLRQFGRLTEALAAFHKYGQMFAASDTTTERYTSTASAFTQQLTALGVQGGVYLFQILAQGAANEAGMAIGDIIIEYNGKTIAGQARYRACPARFA